MPATLEIFKKYSNRYFVETGTHLGEGLQFALNAGFTWIRSVELDNRLFGRMDVLYGNNQHVTLYHGKSQELLKKMIRDINEPITFWLDAHYSGSGTARSEIDAPLLQELQIIRDHHIENHTILIDDIRLLGQKELSFITLEQIKNIFKENYKFSFENGRIMHQEFVDDILVIQHEGQKNEDQ